MSTTYSNIGLTAWTSGSDLFNHIQLANNFQAIDNHDHTSGKGLPIPTGGLQNLAVTGPKVAADAIDASKILDGSVGTNELAANAVTTTKITDANVTNPKLADGSVGYIKTATGTTGLAAGVFNVYRNAALSLANNSLVVFDAATFDVSSWYNLSTGRYIPQIAGYYRLTAQISFSAALTASQFVNIQLRKNGSGTAFGPNANAGTTASPGGMVTTVVQANGSTDFFEIWLAHNIGGSTALNTGAGACFFCGELIGRS